MADRPAEEPAPLAYRLAWAAYALHAALERHLHDTLADLELTVSLADALWQLDPALGPLSRRQLAERLCCDPSNVTFLVDRLEKRRLVSRMRARGDRRVKALALTPAGIKARNRLIATIAESSMFSGLTRAQQQQLTDLLQRCIGLATHPANAPHCPPSRSVPATTELARKPRTDVQLALPAAAVASAASSADITSSVARCCST